MIAAALPLAVIAAATLGPAADGQPSVEVVARVRPTSAAEPACLREAVTGFLAGRGIPVRWPGQDATAVDARSPSERRLTLEIDLTEPARVALTFEDSAGGPKQLREVALEHGLDQVGCESLADVIEASVLAMAATPPPPPPPAAATPPVAIVPVARPDAALDGDRRVLAVAYTVEPVASDTLQSGVELAFGSKPRRSRRRDWMRLSYALPVRVSADAAHARWQSLSMAWAASFASRGPRTWFELAGWMGAGFNFVETASVGVAPESHTAFAFQFGSDFTLGARIARHAALFATLRFAFSSAEPVTLEANGMQIFQSWWMWRPSLVVGARWP